MSRATVQLSQCILTAGQMVVEVHRRSNTGLGGFTAVIRINILYMWMRLPFAMGGGCRSTGILESFECTGGCVLLVLPQEAGPGADGGCAVGVQRWVVSGEALAEEVCSPGQLRVEGGAREAVLHAGDMPRGLQEMSERAGPVRQGCHMAE